MNQPNHFTELNSLLESFVERVCDILAGNFVGAYLVGSFAVGDADKHSDCDFLVVTRRQLTQEQEQLIPQLHAEMFNRPGYWSKPGFTVAGILGGLERLWDRFEEGCGCAGGMIETARQPV
jgi:Nucleotidyltransferase domain